MHTCINSHTHIHTPKYTHPHIQIHTYIHQHIHTYIYSHTYTHIDSYIHTYIVTYIHISGHQQIFDNQNSIHFIMFRTKHNSIYLKLPKNSSFGLIKSV